MMTIWNCYLVYSWWGQIVPPHTQTHTQSCVGRNLTGIHLSLWMESFCRPQRACDSFYLSFKLLALLKLTEIINLHVQNSSQCICFWCMRGHLYIWHIRAGFCPISLTRRLLATDPNNSSDTITQTCVKSTLVHSQEVKLLGSYTIFLVVTGPSDNKH